MICSLARDLLCRDRESIKYGSSATGKLPHYCSNLFNYPLADLENLSTILLVALSLNFLNCRRLASVGRMAVTFFDLL
jgi:hypothetical protein